MLKCLYAAIPYAPLSLSGPLRALSRCGSTPLQNGSTPSRLLAFHWGSWWRSSLRAFLSSFWLPKRRRPSVPSPTPSRMRSLKPMLTKRHSGGRESGRSCAAWVGFARGDYDKLGGSRRTSAWFSNRRPRMLYIHQRQSHPADDFHPPTGTMSWRFGSAP
jgi:hypothetical protein